MECDLCNRAYNKSRKPVCVACAQATLYSDRVEHVKLLLAREKAHAHAEAIVRPGNDGVLAALPQDADWDAISHGVKGQALSRMKGELERVDARIADVETQAQSLRQCMVAYKEYLEDKKRENAKRRGEIGIERKELMLRREIVPEPVHSAERRAARHLAKTHTRTVDARAYVCKYTSNLSGLRQVKDRLGVPTGRYSLHGLVLPTLKDLIGSHAGYAEGVQAEIVLPHSEFPHSAILLERSSYKGSDPAYPGDLGSHSSASSTSRLKRDPRPSTRARLLYLDRPLAALEKEDRKTFGLFLEGVVLLSWNIAWLCRSQGITSVTSFDDVCNIGHNLYLLFRAQEAAFNSRPSLNRNDTAGTDVTVRSDKIITKAAPTQTPIRFGSYSHGSTVNSLSSAQGAAYIQEWRKLQPHRLVDQLKQHFAAEMTGVGWDVVSEFDLDAEREDETPVLVGGASRLASAGTGVGVSNDSAATMAKQGDEDRKANGWMKVRGRSGDV
ncbi:hypothetical protein B0A48_13720 [Cryoendolithus antarcticus]|uniref:Autophagy-related protein 14 n=1 Tax=Cryoendolithus antarcticus TaxID=1507870 RepID=A0A1V8SNB4_9PEZI|nr:hypothetical protein B0A48_13720 [Cryoendolithus antarcticus]